jgi:molybdenum cofactor synthesis domain-containing protein
MTQAGTVRSVIAVEDVQALVFGSCPPLPPRTMPLASALGCVLAADVSSPETVPPFDNTAVDGYAVRAVDTESVPVELDVLGVLAAGAAPMVAVGPGQALRIMTGAPMPEGADAVVMVEESEPLDGDRVRLRSGVRAGDAVRRAGDDVKAGEVVLTAGTVVSPAHVGVLASMGVLEVPVVPKARVGVLSTGDELVPSGGRLQPGQIRESNRPMLLGLVAQAGAEPVDLGLVRDDEDELTRIIGEAAASCDALVSSGGVSMGDFDVVKLVLDRIGDMHWLQIAIKPAKPFAFGRLGRGGPPLFGLPGNPVSALVSFELFARPALRQMMGQPRPGRPELLAVADDGFRRRQDGKVHYVRVQGAFEDDGRLHVRSAGAQGSHQLAASAGANALAVLADGDGVSPGGDVRVLLLDL